MPTTIRRPNTPSSRLPRAVRPSRLPSNSTLQVTVQRAGPYFTNYTKLALDCVDHNVRHMGMYNSLERLEKAQFDPMQERIVAGSIADEVRKVLCRGTSMTASQADEVPAKVKADDKI